MPPCKKKLFRCANVSNKTFLCDFKIQSNFIVSQNHVFFYLKLCTSSILTRVLSIFHETMLGFLEMITLITFTHIKINLIQMIFNDKFESISFYIISTRHSDEY